MPNERVTLRNVIKEMQDEGSLMMVYPTIINAYKAGKISEEATKYIIEQKKFSTSSYYINKSDVANFKEAFLKQFN